MKKKILVVDDEESIRYTFSTFLTENGYDTTCAERYDEALDLHSRTAFDLLFVDIIMDGRNGIELLRAVKKKAPDALVVIITGAPSIDTAAEAVRLGAYDYLVKPVKQNDLLKVTHAALRHKQLSDEKDFCCANIEAVFNSVKDSIITTDTNLRVLEVNNAAFKLCGFSENNIAGKHLQEITTCCSSACVPVLKELLSGKLNGETRYIECLRRVVPNQIVSVSTSPLINRTGQHLGYVMALRDETRLHHLEKDYEKNNAFNRMIGTSREMIKVKNLIETLANVQTTVLVCGESGTGKELIADALHRQSERAKGPLVKVNCGALADTLLESELFGHIHGAFTGAVKDKLGRFHLANGGTIFLDEIGDISQKMQLQLLRVLETMRFERVGSPKTEQVDVRVVAATNRNLKQKVEKGDFRADLYYRLKVIQIALPPLRERRDDIPLLCQHFIEKFNHKFKKNIKALSQEVQDIFQQHNWPGNVRELENTLEHAFILSRENVIARTHLPPEFQFHTDDLASYRHDKAMEGRAIEEALEETSGNKSQAARLLGMSRRNFYRKMEKYNIGE